MSHPETHNRNLTAWLRAAVLGANDGILSIASLVLGVAAAEATPNAVMTAGVAGLIGGSLSMAAGEYVSVSSQRDAEEANLAREKRELAEEPEHELIELTGLLMGRGIPRELAKDVAVALTEHDDLAAHAHFELGLDLRALARPGQAALVSAFSFSIGAAVPLLGMVLAPTSLRVPLTLGAALVVLMALGAWSAKLGNAPLVKATARVVLGGAAAMGVTTCLGWLLGAVVAG